MTKISKKDFIEIEYTGRIKDDNAAFDTTDKKVAKENNIDSEREFGPLIVCVGENQVLKGLDQSLEGKEVGSEYSTVILPENAFGAKNPKLIQMIPTSKFIKQKIQPIPGLQLNIDGVLGTIKTVGGGRTLVDFNHPLAGKELSYKVKINRKVTNAGEQLTGYLQLLLGVKHLQIEMSENKAKVTLKMEIPKEVQGELNNKIASLIPDVSQVEFAKKTK